VLSTSSLHNFCRDRLQRCSFDAADVCVSGLLIWRSFMQVVLTAGGMLISAQRNRASCWDFRVVRTARLAAAYNRKGLPFDAGPRTSRPSCPKLYLSAGIYAWLARRAGPRIGPARASVSVNSSIYKLARPADEAKGLLGGSGEGGERIKWLTWQRRELLGSATCNRGVELYTSVSLVFFGQPGALLFPFSCSF